MKILNSNNMKFQPLEIQRSHLSYHLTIFDNLSNKKVHNSSGSDVTTPVYLYVIRIYVHTKYNNIHFLNKRCKDD